MRRISRSMEALLAAALGVLGCGNQTPAAMTAQDGSAGGPGQDATARESFDTARAGSGGADAGGTGGGGAGAGGTGGGGEGAGGGDASFADARDGDVDASDVDATTATWTGTWASAPQRCGGSFTGQTLRAIVHTSIGGNAARVRFSNTFGNGPLQLRDVHIAQRTTGSSIDPTTDKALTFRGQSSLTIPAGAYDVSDAATFVVKPLSDVAVSFFVVSHSGTTCHQSGFQTNYQASGDVAGEKALSGGTNGSYFFLSNLDVQSPGAEGAVVTLGASITDGYSSRGDVNRRWPNDLAARAITAGRAVGVLNQGISGDGVANAVQRFDRDVLSQPNVKWVIFSDNPINDLGNFNPPTQTEIDQIKTLIARAHARGIKFICSTLTPFQGAGYWSAPKETGRAAMNAFIRGLDSGCDGIVDQDTATHDPANPAAYLPAFNSGDNLHPNEAGLQAIANAVDLSLFR